MLDPNTRSLYTAALTPPPGMVVDQALGATFSMDPAMMLSVPVHLALLGSDRGNALKNGIAVLESVRRLSNRITMFAQRGRLQAPNPPHVLYALLESMVVEVEAPGGGSFHPKFWMMRFTEPNDVDTVLLRLMILSRNLTGDRSWDVAVTLEGQPTGRYRLANRALGTLVASLPEMAFGEVDGKRKEQASRLGDELHRTEWELPPGFDEVSFSVFGLKPNAWRPAWSRRFAVISPFCSDQALETLVETTKTPDALISRPETLGELAADTRDRFRRCLVLDDAAETEDGEDVEEGVGHDTSGLHAKVYVFERGWNTHIVLGSANATDTALLHARNIEVLAELVGKRSRIGGIDNLLGAEGLREVLVDYQAPDSVVPVDLDLQAAERALEAARNAIASADLRIACTALPERHEWRMRLAGPVATLPVLSSARVWPITVAADGHAVDLSPLADAESIELGTFATASITGFLAFELRAATHDLRIRFVLNLPVDGLPGDRDSAILQTVVRNRDGFLRYLMLLLGDLGHGPAPLSDSGTGDASAWSFGGYGNMPLLEELVRAYCRDPNRLREIRHVVRRLTDGDETGEIVPPEFLETWTVFEKALEHHHG